MVSPDVEPDGLVEDAGLLQDALVVAPLLHVLHRAAQVRVLSIG